MKNFIFILIIVLISVYSSYLINKDEIKSLKDEVEILKLRYEIHENLSENLMSIKSIMLNHVFNGEVELKKVFFGNDSAYVFIVKEKDFENQ